MCTRRARSKRVTFVCPFVNAAAKHTAVRRKEEFDFCHDKDESGQRLGAQTRSFKLKYMRGEQFASAGSIAILLTFTVIKTILGTLFVVSYDDNPALTVGCRLFFSFRYVTRLIKDKFLKNWFEIAFVCVFLRRERVKNRANNFSQLFSIFEGWKPKIRRCARVRHHRDLSMHTISL